jgi:hypothetical protein
LGSLMVNLKMPRHASSKSSSLACISVFSLLISIYFLINCYDVKQVR